MAVFLPSDTSTIRYEETDLASLHSRPSHFVCGVYLICVRGTAVVSTGVQQYALGEQTELIFLTGSLIQVLCASDDFTVRLLMFPKDVFLKAVLPIDTPYLNYTHEHPCYRHTEDERSQATWLQINLWMDMAQMLFCGNVSPFRQQQEYNFLQGLLMWLFNTIQEKLSVAKQYSRKQAICHRFMQLVRDVFLFCFYACGMPFVDVAFLKKSQITDGVLAYHRRKTNQFVQIKLSNVNCHFTVRIAMS